MTAPESNVIYSADRRVGRIVLGYLKVGGHTQRALAERLGLPQSSVSDAINGKRHWLLEEIYETADFLGLPAGRLIDPDDPIAAAMLEVRASTWNPDGELGKVLTFALQRTA